MNKKITVIIPCYNVRNYIDRCLTSITEQRFGMDALSIICVNDASTDNTLERLKTWESRFPKDILLIDCKENGRQGQARNLALSHVRTPYVAFVDSDDWIEPDMYEKMYEKAIGLHCDIVCCSSYRDTKDTVSVPTATDASSWLLSVTSSQERKNFIVSNVMGFNCWDKLIRTDFLRDNNILFPERLAYEDICWGFLLYLYANSVCIMENKFYHYCVNESSTVLAVNQPYHKDIFAINDLKWNAAQERGFWREYSAELKFDYLITGYLSILKILALRYTVDTYDDYLRLYEVTRSRVPDFSANPYLEQLSEFQQLQIHLLENQLTKTEWNDFCRLIKSLT